MKGTISKSGVFELYDFRDNLIIDSYHPIFHKMKGSKINQMRSENSEDALTWNVFKSLQQINPRCWFPYFVSRGLNIETEQFYFYNPLQHMHVPEIVQIKLWQIIQPPPSLKLHQKDEGSTEVDIIIEGENYVWFIEAKYKSDISMKTTNNQSRDQIIRNIDVGSYYAGVRNFYFSLLILDEKNSSKGYKMANQYKQELESDMDKFLSSFDHRSDALTNLKEISVFYWEDLASIFKYCSNYAEDQFERDIAKRAFDWLQSKNIIQVRNWWEEDISNKYPSYPKELEYILKVQKFAENPLNNRLKSLFLPKGYDEHGFPTDSMLKYHDVNIDTFYDNFEHVYNQFNDNGLPWWWKGNIKDFQKKFFEVLEACEELGGVTADEFWKVFKSNPEETLRISYVLLIYWYFQ
ncbi:hypothetical protein [Litchfieldia alkalitelluris]|uniref:hypothetical protein n=1 Tax=Litchfieldia alkalitelluris TaxID=304268 RepID=UPI0009975854|nr:hypothetical protein [Litchfieldia alkalitelluris]